MTVPSRQQLVSGWYLKAKDAPEEAWMPVAKVPSQVHVDLIAHKKIADPFVDLNEKAAQWVDEKNWVYKTTFQVASPPSGTITDLVFEGLDTFASVQLNGHETLKTDNMFLSYRVNVSDKVTYGAENLLEITFDSALIRGRELVRKHAHEHDFLVRQTEAGRLPSRKAQYNWGWDWGPVLVTAGPWKPVYVEQYVARIDDLWAKYEVSEDLKICSGTIEAVVAGILQDGDKIIFTLSDGRAVVNTAATVKEAGTVTVPFSIDNPKLWYPRGYGEPIRYTVQASIIRAEAELYSLSKLIGFRRTALIQQPDARGTSFYFRINNIDVFAGGSCWVPADSFLAQVSPGRYHDWIRLTAEGNQVMLRVWGGGVYEDDALLDACDEFGVLIWHDFQFACGNYPTYNSYLENFEAEARYQVRRLRWHPSVIVWAGNNEDYQVQERYKLDYDYENKDAKSWLKSTFPARYIYEHLLPKVVKEEDPYQIYHPSSPWGDGKPTADPTVGDIHQWNIWHGTMNKYQEADQLGGRFVSEFGLVAYPHLETVSRMITDPAQRRPGSMAMDFHNKAIGHERRLITYIAENFQVKYDIGAYTHLSQMVQAECMRAAYKAWRRDWGKPGARGCGGVLVWQLNDCWPTISWAVVDYYLVKKPAYYAIKRALKQIDVGVKRTYHDWTQTGDWVDEHSGLKTGQVDQTLAARKIAFDVWIANSSVDAVEVDVKVRFISVASGRDVAKPKTTHITAAANSTTDVFTAAEAPAAVPHAGDCSVPFDFSKYDPYVIHTTIEVAGNVIAKDSAWPDPVKYLDMYDRNIRFEWAEASRKGVYVMADKPVMGFVFEEVAGMGISDNAFDLMPGEKQLVEVLQGPSDPREFRWTHIGAEQASNPMPKDM
ncbi:hypothetical protein NLU13_2812 [Sarocladium strictum]|uniref:Beta-mannosidase B n=1 Tax=Sarocladium strictum TaxID=5046 RepID=A0AA39L9N3_SARSR|nr:hypothetical protein NLU13_2812 [Sarocladium strictum]